MASFAWIAGGLTITATALSLLRANKSWVRVWDFPRLQVAFLGVVALVCDATETRRNPSRRSRAESARLAFRLTLGLATAYQFLRVWRYTPLAPREVAGASRSSAESRLSIVEANVMMSNRDSGPLLHLLRQTRPDVIVCSETDRWWCDQLQQLSERYPHRVSVPRSNTYGMLLLSRLPVIEHRVEFLTDCDVPSISAKLRLRSGAIVWLNCLHPRPPTPDKTATTRQRDRELMIVAWRVRGSKPVVVCGDLNDVAWSRTTRQFQAVSGLLDPRKGRGFYATFNAFVPGLRFPIDHYYHSSDFRLVHLDVLPGIGSDHFPVHIVLSHAEARS